MKNCLLLLTLCCCVLLQAQSKREPIVNLPEGEGLLYLKDGTRFSEGQYNIVRSLNREINFSLMEDGAPLDRSEVKYFTDSTGFYHLGGNSLGYCVEHGSFDVFKMSNTSFSVEGINATYQTGPNNYYLYGPHLGELKTLTPENLRQDLLEQGNNFESQNTQVLAKIQQIQKKRKRPMKIMLIGGGLIATGWIMNRSNITAGDFYVGNAVILAGIITIPAAALTPRPKYTEAVKFYNDFYR